MKKYPLILSLFIFISLLAGCAEGTRQTPSAAPPTATASTSGEILTPEQKIKGYLETLCSREFAGRAPGTKGGELAAEWLAQRLSETGIAPYCEDGYEARYTGFSNTFGKSEMTVYYNGGERLLAQGADFFLPLGFGNYSITISSDDGNYQMLEAGETGDIRTSNDSEQKFAYFENSECFHNAAGGVSSDTSGIARKAQLSAEIYSLFKAGEFDRVEIVNEVI